MMKYKNYIETFLLFFCSPIILLKVKLAEAPAIALVLDRQNSTSLSVAKALTANQALQKFSKSVNEEWYEINNSKMEAFRKQSLKCTKTSLAKKKPSSHLVADVIPIENYKVKPPEPPEQEEGISKPNISKPSTSNEQPKKPPTQQPHTLIQETLIQKLRQSKKEPYKKLQNTILYNLTLSAIKYPFVVSPTDNFGFSPVLFQPYKDENYIDTDVHVRDSQGNQTFFKFNYGNFPKSRQFYWVLDDDRIVIETQGTQTGMVYQGKETETNIIGNLTSKQSFWGLQSITAIPVDFRDLAGKVDTSNLSVTSIAGQLINPEGIPAGKVVINSGINLEDPNVTVLKNPTPALGSGSTSSSDGGQALFQSLDSINAPQILQGFPTTNLKPLLDGGNVRLAKGEIIPNNVLEASGIFWGDILTGKGFNFTAPISSLPGIKIAQLSKFDNTDLLNIAVNPYLTQAERDLHYLNSLLWVSLGKNQVFQTTSESQNTSIWNRFYVNYPHNRSLIQYDKVAPKATYSNIFSNPGLSITANFDKGSIDYQQTANASLGMIIGEIFEAINLNNIDQNLKEARQKFKNREQSSPLSMQPTYVQKREINQRLNRTLSYANSSSGLEQVSGTITFPSQITPNNSTIFQRTLVLVFLRTQDYYEPSFRSVARVLVGFQGNFDGQFFSS